MAVFPSSEWLTEYVDQINGSAKFAAAAQTFEADISYVFEAEPDKGVPRDIWCRAAFSGGSCQWAEYDVDAAQAREATFVIRAERNGARLIKRYFSTAPNPIQVSSGTRL